MIGLFRLFVLGILAILIGSCGGVIGSIKQYEYDLPPKKLNIIVENIYSENPELIPPTDSLNKSFGQYYNDKYKEYSLYIKEDKKYLLHFCIINEGDSTSNKSRIALLTGAQYGEVLKLAPKLNKKEKKLYTSLYEKYFLKKINSKIKEKASQ